VDEVPAEGRELVLSAGREAYPKSSDRVIEDKLWSYGVMEGYDGFKLLRGRFRALPQCALCVVH
jgi:hypothetical protein